MRETGLLGRVAKTLRTRHTLRSHLWQSLANYTQQGFGLILGVILARLLKPADFGMYGLALAIMLLALLPATWSLAPTLLADGGRTSTLFHNVAAFTWVIVAVRLGIVAAVVVWFVATGNHPMASLCFIIGLIETFRELNNVQKGFLEGSGRFEPNFFSVATNMVFCIIVVIPLAFVYRNPYILTLPAAGTIVGDFIIYRRCSRRSVVVRPRLTVPREFFHHGFWLWLGAVSEVGLARFDKWFVGHFRGDAALGHYSRAFGYAPLGFLALNSFATNPTVSGLARCQTPLARRRLFMRTAMILFGGGFLNWIIFFPFARLIVLSVFGPQWHDTIPVFRAFASLSLAYAVSALPMTVLYAQKRYREVAIGRTTALIMFVVILFVRRDSLSITAVAWTLQGVLILQGLILSTFIPSAFNDTNSAQNWNPQAHLPSLPIE